jgi:hypothetical protein
MFSWKNVGILELLILLTVLFLSFQTRVAVAKFGEGTTTKGQVKCCFGKGGGFLSGRCLEMSETQCALKRGSVVPDCKQCEGWVGEAAPTTKGRVKCCFGRGGGSLSGRCLDMTQTECAFKRGSVVPDCKQCEGR